VILSETGDREEEATALAGTRVVTVSVSHSPAAGRIVGERLLSLGHRSVAYVSANHESQWSRNRLAGLAQAFSAAGEGAIVHAFTREDVTDMRHRQTLGDGLDQLRIACRQSTGGGLSKLVAVIERYSSQGILGGELEHELAREAVPPLLQRVAALAGATAWVAANDATACVCLDFLEQRGKQAPQDVSLIGFDDTPEAATRRVSSYNFDCAGAIHAALRCVLDPREWTTRTRTGRPIEIEGYVVERQTTGKAVR
jgi:DNA-binding LacI/PurR family transcriptional regulator